MSPTLLNEPFLTSLDSSFTQTAQALRRVKHAVLTCHVAPDGDALGATIALYEGLKSRGTECVFYLWGEDPIAPEWHFLTGLKELERGEPPSDLDKYTVCVSDCGSLERLGDEKWALGAQRIINIDHHVDNTLFGDINLILPQVSSSAEVAYHLLKELEVALTPTIAQALYTGMLTDTGRFQYSNTRPMVHRIIAELLEEGLDPAQISRSVYEDIPLAKLKLLQRTIEKVHLSCEGRLISAVLEETDYRETDANDLLVEGLIDQLRAVKGVKVAALIKAQSRYPGIYKVSLRSNAPLVPVNEVAHHYKGGGHLAAAGFTTTEPPKEIIAFLEKTLFKPPLT